MPNMRLLFTRRLGKQKSLAYEAESTNAWVDYYEYD